MVCLVIFLIRDKIKTEPCTRYFYFGYQNPFTICILHMEGFLALQNNCFSVYVLEYGMAAQKGLH